MRRMLVVLSVGVALIATALPAGVATGTTPERDGPKHGRGTRPAASRTATPDPRNVHDRASRPTAPGRSPALPSFGFISNGTLRLGINPEGHIDATSGVEDLGLLYLPTGGDALIPGCWCEGWGLADVGNSISGYASVDNGGVSPNVTVTAFDVTADTAESVVEIGGRLRVRHFYHPSSVPNLYKVDVTVTNIGGDQASLVYRRDMDWDVPPTEFDEFVTLQGSAPYLLDSTDDGFAFVDPLEPLTDLGERGTFLDAGPDDRGGAFDVSLGNLAPGEATNLTLFYGAAGTEGDALAALQTVQAQVYSLGEPNTADGARLGTPNTFMFGIKGTCQGDADCDYLSDANEATLGTNPDDQDTDHDGLLDPWEAPPTVPGSGFHGPDFFLHTPTRDEVFGPFNPGFCPLPGSDLRLDGQVACFNDPPDPRHRDVFLEIDWQDCRIGSCPEILGLKVDPLHHAPNLPALGQVTTAFADAPISNPDGTFGVNLHVLIDEAIPHTPNCDQDESDVRPEFFGTFAQRTDLNSPEIMLAKRTAVRYVWSGHSSQSSSGAACPNPDGPTFFFQGFGFTKLADYDWSPFGDANVGSQDVLLTLGPVWSCSSQIKLNKDSPFLGPCYRQIKIIQTFDPFGGLGQAVVPIPGIFPAKVKDQFGNEKTVRWPVNQLLGLGESAGITQLWARGLTHLLGHALGIPDEFTVGNRPDVPGIDSNGDGRRDSPDAPEPYASWEGLNYVPGGGFGTLQEAFPDYDTLAAQDLDGDGVPEGEDNCAGIFNPKDGDRQPDRDFDDFGDACDFDLDGDGMGNPATRRGTPDGGAGLGTGAAPQVEIVAASDPYPADTDNDGMDNDADADDDNDGILDTADNCVIVVNADQLDTDGDGAGDACDLDDDGDGPPDALEATVGSAPASAASTPEVLGQGTACSDGVDNDGDGARDGADGGCVDDDGDSMPNALDNCPAVTNAADGFADGDGDRIGDACDSAVDPATVTIDAVTDPEVGASDLGTAVAWHADKDGSYVVLVGGADCTDGLQVDAGTYFTPVSLAASIPAPLLAEGTNVVRVCLSTSAGTFSAVATVEKNTTGQQFDFQGFFPPVDNVPVLNVLKAGAAVPVKFSLGGDQGLDILAPGSPASQLMDCSSAEGLDVIEETVSSGHSELQYDPASGQYTYVWKTSTSWSGTCRRFILELTDGSVHEAYFTFKK